MNLLTHPAAVAVAACWLVALLVLRLAGARWSEALGIGLLVPAGLAGLWAAFALTFAL